MTAPARPDAVRVVGLTKQYKAARAVDGISFSIPQGSITALLGGNGAGKTTTLGMLLRVFGKLYGVPQLDTRIEELTHAFELGSLWSRNMANLLISPLSRLELVLSMLAMSVLRMLVSIVPITVLAIFFFDYKAFAINVVLLGLAGFAFAQLVDSARRTGSLLSIGE